MDPMREVPGTWIVGGLQGTSQTANVWKAKFFFGGTGTVSRIHFSRQTPVDSNSMWLALRSTGVMEVSGWRHASPADGVQQRGPADGGWEV